MTNVSQALPQVAASDNLFWLFSSAAQTIAAFVAFLLAGYALVHTMMEAAAAADETLVEIHEELKRRYYRRLAGLVVLTAVAIVACFAVILFNGASTQWFIVLTWAAGLFVLASIAGGVGFVITVVDPGKYRKAAVQMAREEEARPAPKVPWEGLPELQTVKRGDFADAFINLEELVRQLWEHRTHGERLRKTTSSSPPAFREMLQALNLSEALPPALAKELEALNRYRNLVFHGHLKTIDPDMVHRVRDAVTAVAQLLNAG